jgi:hypothetical protein
MGKRNTIEKCNANTLARTRFFVIEMHREDKIK